MSGGGPVPAGGGPDTAGGVRLRVLSYNVHSLRDDRAALAEVVRAIRPDVALIQESPHRLRWRTRNASLAAGFGMVWAAGGLPSRGNSVLTTLRVRVHRHGHAQFRLVPGHHLRGAVYARCSVGRVPFTVVGTHLSTTEELRADQAAQLRRLTDRLDGPLIVAGDLNETAEAAGWRTLSAGLVDAAEHAGCADRHTFSCANPRRRIDGIFVDPRVSIVGYDVPDTPQVHLASDHFPVVVDLVLPAA